MDATLKALDAFSGGLWVILGGKDKGLDYALLRAPLAAKAHAALLIGAAAGKIAAQLSGAVPLVEAGTLEAAVRLRLSPRPARRHRAAGAGLRQLRPIPQLRASRRGLQEPGPPTGGGAGKIIWRNDSKPTGSSSAPCWPWSPFGLLILYSASSIMAELDPRYGSTWHFVLRQAGWAAVAVVVMMALKHARYRKLQNPAVAFGGHRRRLLLLAAVYFIDSAHHRWLRMGPGRRAALGAGQARAGDLSGLLRHLARARHQQPALHAGARPRWPSGW